MIWLKRFNKLLKYIIFVLVLFVVLVSAVLPKNVSAKIKDVDCYLCKKDKDDPLYEKERQFYEKIRVIKVIFGDSIDEIVLAATVLHKFDLDTAVTIEYDESFDEEKYMEQWQSLLNGKNDVKNNGNYGFSQEQIDEINARVNENRKIDLITTAAIVMLDSNKFGPYNEEAYKKALAGDKLFGNDDEIFGDFLNYFVCGITETAIVATDAFPYITSIFDGGAEELFSGVSLEVGRQTLYNRVVDTATVCQNGYIGGLYNQVGSVKDEDRKQKLKKEYAEDILKLANYYKKMYGEDSDNKYVCSVEGNTQATVFNGMSTDEYINTLGPIAQADYSRNGVFASVTLAQSIVESGWGKSGLTQRANNMFGIKCSSAWTGECINMSTGEYGSGGYYMTDAAFRKYDSVEASLNDHSLFLIENSRYADHGVFRATTYQEQITAIHEAGYATAPNYASAIIDIIKSYDLDRWDVKTAVTSDIACGVASKAGWSIRTIKPTPSDPSFIEMEATGNSGNRGQCVWYAKGRAFEIVNALKDAGKLDESSASRIKSLLARAYGNGGDIYDNAKSVFNSSNDIRKPKAGSYIVWKYPNWYGHVAIVEDVDTVNNTITITMGHATNTTSCPNDRNWGCVNFEIQTMSLDYFYSNYGPNYIGGYSFSGYVYFLEPLS